MKLNQAEQLLAAFVPFFPQATGIGSYVGGRLLPGAGELISLQNPANGQATLQYADADASVVQAAVEAAATAQAAWWKLTHAARGRIVLRWATRSASMRKPWRNWKH